MSSEKLDIEGQVQVLFTYFYDDELGGFYTSYAEKRDESVDPSPFSTIEALYSLMHSPAKSEFKEEISQSLRFLLDKLEDWEGKARPYMGAEDAACDYSTLSISFSLIVLSRSRKFIQNHDISAQLENRVTEMVRKQLRLLLDAQQEDGWSYVPRDRTSDWNHDYEPNVYCTAIALQALINCKNEDFPERTNSIAGNPGMIIVDGFRALLDLTEIPETEFDGEDFPDQDSRDIFRKAVLMAHWMHVLSHVLYDTERWADTVEHPSNLENVHGMLKKSSELLCKLILHTDQYPDDLEHGFADINYELELEYPQRTPQGKIRQDTFSFELPGSTALPALVLNPNIPIWSEANTKINQDVIDQFTSRRDDLQRVDIGGGKSWLLHHFSAPLVGITYMQSINQGIISLIQYFIREGEVLNIDSGEADVEADSDTSVDSRHAPEFPVDSVIVKIAIQINKFLVRIDTRIKQSWNGLRENSRLILFPLFSVSLIGYVYSAISDWPDVQILVLASVTGFLSFLTIYEFFIKWIDNRALSMMSGALTLIVVIASSTIPTSLSSDITIVAGFVMQTIAVITNILVNEL